MALPKRKIDDILEQLPGADFLHLHRLRRECVRLRSHDGEDPDVHFALGHIGRMLHHLASDEVEAKREWLAAQGSFARAWEQLPEQPMFLVNHILFSQGVLPLDEILECAAYSFAKNPDCETHPVVLTALAEVLLEGDLREDAEAYFEEALERLALPADLPAHEWPNLHVHLILLALDLNEVEAALELGARYYSLASGMPIGEQAAVDVVLRAKWDDLFPDQIPRWVEALQAWVQAGLEHEPEPLASSEPLGEDPGVRLLAEFAPFRARANAAVLVGHG